MKLILKSFLIALPTFYLSELTAATQIPALEEKVAKINHIPLHDEGWKIYGQLNDVLAEMNTKEKPISDKVEQLNALHPHPVHPISHIPPTLKEMTPDQLLQDYKKALSAFLKDKEMFADALRSMYINTLARLSNTEHTCNAIITELNARK